MNFLSVFSSKSDEQSTNSDSKSPCDQNDDSRILGVSLRFLYEFMEQHNIPPEMSTEEVVTNIIIPETTASGKSYVDSNLQDNSRITRNFKEPVEVVEIDGKRENMGQDYVIKMRYVYLIHSWKMPFSVLVDTAYTAIKVEQTAFCYIPPKEDVWDKNFFWIDIFCSNQHNPEWSRESFNGVMALTNHVVAALWPSQPIALERAWCLMEMWTALALQIPLQLCCPEETLNEMDLDSLSVNLRNSLASNSEDVEKIVEIVEGSTTVEGFEAELTRLMRSKLKSQQQARDPFPACFDGNGLVTMADGLQKQVKNIQPGDKVKTHCGKIAEVQMVTVDLLPEGHCEMCDINGVLFTPEHPVLCGDGVWRLPKTLVPVKCCRLDKIFNFELNKGCSSVLINGIPVVTLGSQLTIDAETDALYGWGWEKNPLRAAYLSQTGNRRSYGVP